MSQYESSERGAPESWVNRAEKRGWGEKGALATMNGGTIKNGVMEYSLASQRRRPREESFPARFIFLISF